MNRPLSTRIGELFAHVQDLFDTMIHTAIKRVNENDKLDKKTGKVVGFITRIGDSYFNKYKDIKNEIWQWRSVARCPELCNVIP